MDALLKILLAVSIILITLVMALMLFLIYPFKYDIDIAYDEKLFIFTFKYSIIYFFLSFDFSNPVKCRIELLSKKIFDSSSVSKDIGKKEISTDVATDLVKDKERLESQTEFVKDVEETKEVVKDLFNSAKKMETRQKAERRINSEKAELLIDRCDKYIPRNTIYVLKKILKELKKTYIFIVPKKYKVEISYGIKDPYIMGLSYIITAPISIMSDESVDIKSNFMAGTFKGDIHMSNRMPKICLLMPLIRLLLDKRFREIILKK